MAYYCSVSRDIVGKLSPNETYTLFCLLSKTDFQFGRSYIRQETLRGLTDIKKADTLQAHLNKLCHLGIIRKTTILLVGNRGRYKSTTYHYRIPRSNAVKVDINGLLENKNISSKQKGFMILLECLSPHGNYLPYNKSQISRSLNISLKTTRSYICQLIELKLLVETTKGFEFVNSIIY